MREGGCEGERVNNMSCGLLNDTEDDISAKMYTHN